MVTAQMVKELREKTGAGMLDCKKALEATGTIDAAITWLREKGIAKAAKKADRIAAEGLCDVIVKGNQAVVFELNSETDFVSKNAQFLDLLKTIGEVIVDSDAKCTDCALKLEKDGKTVETLLAEATASIGEKITLRRVSRFTKTDSQNFGAYKHMGGRIVSLTLLEGANEDVAKDVAMHVAAINPKYLSQENISAEVVEQEKNILTQEALNEGKPAAIVEKMVMGRLNKYLKEICLLNQPFVKNPDETVEKFVANNKGSIMNYIRLEVGEGIEKAEVDFAAEVAAQMK